MSTTTSKYTVRPFPNPPERLQGEALLRVERKVMHAFSRISRKDTAGLPFEETYRLCYNLVLHRYPSTVLRMLRLAANAAVRNLRPNQVDDAGMMLADVTQFYSRVYRLADRPTRADDLIAAAREERKAWAMRVLERIPPLWREYYLRPGGVFETSRGDTWRALALEASLGAADAADAMPPAKRARR